MINNATVVLIPGLGNTEQLWSAQTTALKPHHDVVIPDYRGSESIAEMADTVMELAPEVGPLSLVGFSLGGYIALDIMGRYPERIERLALISSSPYADDEDTKRQRQRLMEKAAEDYAALLKDMTKFIVSPMASRADEARRILVAMGRDLGAEEFCRQQRVAMERQDCRDVLATIQCPTDVLCGSEDPITNVAGNRFIADHIEGATLTIVDGASHLLPLEEPARVTAFLLDWLRRERNSGPSQAEVLADEC